MDEWSWILPLLLFAGAAAAALTALSRAAQRNARLQAEVVTLRERLAAQDSRVQRAERQRRELLANVSHDLRTPLAAMQGYLELLLLRQGQLDATEARNYLQTAARQSERLGRLVGDLFDLAQLDGGELQGQPEDFVLAELVQDVLQKFAAEAQRRGISLRADGPLPAARVHGDLGLIARVIEALVDNALRHTPRDGRITLTEATLAGRVRLAVADTGSGIEPAALAGLFDRFEHGERVRGGAQDGRPGLGLAIARRIVHLHGGELAVASRPGEGSEFSFTLAPAQAGQRSTESRRNAA
jgi:signal transduction histidine kinase